MNNDNNLAEIRQRLVRLSELSAELRAQLKGLKGPAGLEMRETVKKQGKKIGVGAGIATFGVFVVVGAAMYINALLIILLDLAMPLWVAALIVVLGMLLFGGAMAGIGITIARKAAKDLKEGGGVLQSLKETSDEMKKTVEGLQVVAKQEAGERQKQLKGVLDNLKPALPFIIGAYVGYRLVKREVRRRKTRRMILEELMGD